MVERVKASTREASAAVDDVLSAVAESNTRMQALKKPGINPPHPGELLREDVQVPLGIDVTEAARRLGMSRSTLFRVLHGHAGISPDLAVRLERAGVSTARFWMTLQANYDLSLAEQRAQPKVVPLQPEHE